MPLSAYKILGPEGPFQETVNGFAPREGQRELAKNIEQAITRKQVLMAEAGTGTGKTLAYLVPVLSGERKVVISTATKQLQDQLIFKDIPDAQKALQTYKNVVVLKGRSNYLCQYRLESIADDGLLGDRQAVADLKAIQDWAPTTKSGDRSSFAKVPDHASIWPQVTSTKDNCLQQDCDFYDQCFFMKARKAAQTADVVVINHHIYLADWQLQQQGFGEILPEHEVVIFDEAHKLLPLFDQVFSQRFSSKQFSDFVEDVKRSAMETSVLKSLITTLDLAHDTVRKLSDAFPEKSQKAALMTLKNEKKWQSVLSDLITNIQAVRHQFLPIYDHDKTSRRLYERFVEFLVVLGSFGKALQVDAVINSDAVALSQPEQTTVDHDTGREAVFWWETYQAHFSLFETPLNPAASRPADPGLTVIFTSATLGAEEQMNTMIDAMRLKKPSVIRLPSPFDYQNQSLCVVPRSLPLPAHPDYLDKFAEQIRSVAEVNSGGTLVLLTSYRAMYALKKRLTETDPKLAKRLLVQGDAGEQIILDQFKKTDGAVLLATAKFWEGVDLPGDWLTCVMIDKLPFAMPDDPILQAKINEAKRAQKSGFDLYQLPPAVLMLQQGAGRLIRSFACRGVLIIGDNRLVTKPYGATFLQALPPMPRSRDFEQALQFLDTMKASTKSSLSPGSDNPCHGRQSETSI